MKTKTPSTANSMNRAPVRLALVLIALALTSFALSPQARAVCQQGCNLNNGNTFLGEDALLNDNGVDNTAIGLDALFSNAGGSYNVGLGFQALRNNTIGDFNVATGRDTLFSNTSGSSNTANGIAALFSNSTGNSNTAIGADALLNNATGSNNIALGNSAGSNLTTGSNNIDIGNTGVTAESGKIRIGTKGTHTAAFIAGISGVSVSGSQVMVNANGKLGVPTSSKRFKEGIKPIDKASEAIWALQPVSFRYKNEIDPDGVPQFGLVAEDVAKVNSDLVVRDENGEVYAVRYDAVNAMLLNEFLKEHAKVQKLEAALDAVNKRLKEQDAKIDKVNARVELANPPARVVDNR